MSITGTTEAIMTTPLAQLDVARVDSPRGWECRHPVGQSAGRGEGDFDDDQPGQGRAGPGPEF